MLEPDERLRLFRKRLLSKRSARRSVIQTIGSGSRKIVRAIRKDRATEKQLEYFDIFMGEFLGEFSENNTDYDTPDDPDYESRTEIRKIFDWYYIEILEMNEFHGFYATESEAIRAVPGLGYDY